MFVLVFEIARELCSYSRASQHDLLGGLTKANSHPPYPEAMNVWSIGYMANGYNTPLDKGSLQDHAASLNT